MFFWQWGGGLYIWSSTSALVTIQGTATLTDTNVYDNQADKVCSTSEPSQTFPANHEHARNVPAR